MLGQLAGYFLSGAQTELEDEVQAAVGADTAVTATGGDQAQCCACDPELNDWVVIAQDVAGMTADTVGINGSSTPGTPCSNQTVEDNWTLTPAACFHARLLSPLRAASSLENLLIEHPSMSVYVRPSQQQQQQQQQRARRSNNTVSGARPQQTVANITTTTNSAQLAAAQQTSVRDSRKWLGQCCLSRWNKCRQIESSGNQRARRRHHYNTRHSGVNNNRKC